MSGSSSRLRTLLSAVLDFRHLPLIGTGLFVLILGSAVFLVYHNAERARTQIQEDFNQQQLILARQAAAQIDAELRDLQVEFESLRRHRHGLAQSTEQWQAALQEAFERTQDDGLIETGLIGPEGQPRVCVRKPGAGSPADAEVSALRELDPTPTLQLGPLQVERRGTSEHTERVLSDLVTQGDGGVLYARINVTHLVAQATRSIRSGRTGYAWVIDSRGTFLYHPEAQFIGKSAFEARRERKPYVSFSEINHIMKEQMLRGQQGTGTYHSGWHRGAEGEMTKLIAFTPVRSELLHASRFWSVAVVAPESEVAAAIQGVYLRHLRAEAALIAGMFVFGMLGFLVQRRLRQAAERRVGQQEKYMTSILANSTDAILFVDNDNRVQVWNRGAETMFGYSAEEMIGSTFHRLVPEEIDADGELERIREETVGTGHLSHYLAPRVTKDGRRIMVDISRTLVRSQEGDPVGSTVIIRDVTEQVELEQRIYNTEKLASLGNLAAGVAHEINNPLAIILGFVDLLKDRLDPDAPEAEDLAIIEQHANRAKAIVEDLLGFARVTEGREDSVDVVHSLTSVANIVRNMLLTSKIELEVDLDDRLPRVAGDSREFQQVIFNLVNNSVAAMKETGGTLTVSARRDGNWVHVNVSDTGTGIPNCIKPRLFDPFFTTKKVGEGTGLGLSLCFGIVTKYGGKMDFTSSAEEDYPGRPTGTTFTVSMPVCSESAATGEDGEPSELGEHETVAPGKAIEPGSITLLMVDDDQEFLESMALRLEHQGFEVVAASSGEEAVQAARNHELDLALLDLNMPGLDGKETLEALKTERDWIETVIFTAEPSLQSAVECAEVGAFSYLDKAAGMDQLLETLKEAYKKRVMNKRALSAERMDEILRRAQGGSSLGLLRRLHELDREGG